MTTPTNRDELRETTEAEELVEEVARSIAAARMKAGSMGPWIAIYPEEEFAAVFDGLWRGARSVDERQREAYRSDARAALKVALEAAATHLETVLPTDRLARDHVAFEEAAAHIRSLLPPRS